MQKKFFIILLVLVIGVFSFLLIPKSANAAGGLIPCASYSNNTQDTPCTLCHFVVGFKGLVDFGMNLITIAAIVGIFFAGVMYVISSGDQKMMESAKAFLGASIKGFAIFFLAWLIVTIVMWTLAAKSDLGLGQGHVWWQFTCSTQSTSGQTSGGTAGQTTAPTSPATYICTSNTGGTCKTTCNTNVGETVLSQYTCASGVCCKPNGTGTNGDCTTITSQNICTLAVGCKWTGSACIIDSATGKCGLTASQKQSYSAGVICCVTTNKFDCSGSNVCQYASISLNQGCSDVCGNQYATKIDNSNCQNKLGY